ncbi:MAG TPA: IS3 family transposase [Opitutaceae bacterium]|nr:IS3 family transposase [Opitutaceae bacterium]
MGRTGSRDSCGRRACGRRAPGSSASRRSRSTSSRPRRTCSIGSSRSSATPGLTRSWAADITYIPTREGWLYLAVILDLATRRVVGWALRARLDQELALAALRMALQHRGACGGLHHSDRGVQYASAAYQRLLNEAGFTVSMSRTGDCWDNAVVESVFATLTKELLNGGIFATRVEARRELFEFIEIWYNRQRRHSSLGYPSRAQFEAELLKAS